MLEVFFQLKDDEICLKTTLAYSYLTYADDETLDKLLTDNFIRRVFELLNMKSIHILPPAIRIIGNILSGDSRHTKVIIFHILS